MNRCCSDTRTTWTTCGFFFVIKTFFSLFITEAERRQNVLHILTDLFMLWFFDKTCVLNLFSSESLKKILGQNFFGSGLYLSFGITFSRKKWQLILARPQHLHMQSCLVAESNYETFHVNTNYTRWVVYLFMFPKVIVNRKFHYPARAFFFLQKFNAWVNFFGYFSFLHV